MNNPTSSDVNIKNLKPGLLFILSAPAGCGKTTLVEMLCEEFSNVVPSVSFTTRPKRAGEINGIHYNFVSEEEFKTLISKDEFLEYVQLYGYYYGTSKFVVKKNLNEGKHVILVIDTQGALKLKNNVNAPLIFVAPPSFKELERRLRARQTESDAVIKERLKIAEKELQAQNKYDYVFINDDLFTAYQVLRSILIAEEHKVR